MRISSSSVISAVITVTAVNGIVCAQWDGGGPPPYTLPTAPTIARAGTVAAIADNSNQMNVFG